jgi:hypothetical protein
MVALFDRGYSARWTGATDIRYSKAACNGIGYSTNIIH